MMLFKLSLRNIRKSMQNYLIYFATLILGVAIFYVFNSLESQTVMMKVSADTREIVKMMMSAMAVVSVFVSFVLGFLVVYASSFLMKRRKKEFGIYMLLGMSKRKISGILIMETIMIGLISLVVGLLLGVVASQGMSIVVANMFEADMTSFRFIVSREAILKTVLYFMVMYVIVIALDAFVVGKARLLTLLHSEKHAQASRAKNPILCIIAFAMACVLLGTAYYKVTAGAQSISDLGDLGLQIAKGIVGTFLFFWSVSGLLLTVVKGRKRFYYKGLNCFSTKELSSRVNTTVFSGGIICLLLFFTICILSSAVSIKRASDAVLKRKASMDIMFYMSYSNKDTEISEYLQEYGIDMGMFRDITEVKSYVSEELTEADILTKGMADDKSWDADNQRMAEESAMVTMKLSDYNRQAEALHIETYTLDDDEYMMVGDYSMAVEMFDKGLAAKPVIRIGGREYRPKYSSCQKGFVGMSNTEDCMGVVIVPDSADLSAFDRNDAVLLANYATEDEAKKEELDQYFMGEEYDKLVNPNNKNHPYISVGTRSYLYTASVGLAAMIVFIGIYLGIVFLISGAAILALKELSEAADNREKYRILRRIGVEEKQISRSLAAQCSVFFGLPLLLAVIHSIFGMQTAMFILSAFGQGGLLTSILISAAVILGIYGIYFWITYACSRKIISE